MSFLKVLELGIALSLLGWRMVARPAERWPLDVAVVLILLWIALALAEDRPRVRTGMTVGASVWLFAVYALTQGPHTFWLFTE